MIEDVPPETTVVGNPGHPVRVEGKPVEGPDTDWIHLPDPIAEAIKELSSRIAELERQLAEATGEGEPSRRRDRAAPQAGAVLRRRLGTAGGALDSARSRSAGRLTVPKSRLLLRW